MDVGVACPETYMRSLRQVESERLVGRVRWSNAYCSLYLVEILFKEKNCKFWWYCFFCLWELELKISPSLFYWCFCDFFEFTLIVCVSWFICSVLRVLIEYVLEKAMEDKALGQACSTMLESFDVYPVSVYHSRCVLFCCIRLGCMGNLLFCYFLK